jgi:hypothetical protein
MLYKNIALNIILGGIHNQKGPACIKRSPSDDASFEFQDNAKVFREHDISI